MFVKRKFKKFRKYAEKEISRTSRYMEKDPNRFDDRARKEILKVENALQKAIEQEDLGELTSQLKEYKRVVDQRLPLYQISIVREYVEAIAIALVLALFIRAFIIQAFKIPSGSMIPTLLVGDHLVVNKFIYGLKIPFKKKKILPLSVPKRGDIIVFQFPGDLSKDYIKRVVGLPGDTIEIDGHQIYLNGEQVAQEPMGEYKYTDSNLDIPITSYLYTETLGNVEHSILFDSVDDGIFGGSIQGMRKKIQVPPNQYFVMGDNRDRSNDSRFWGFVDFNLIRGKAMVIYFSWPPKQLVRFAKVLH